MYDAFYKLTDNRSQIRSYVFDVVRATVPNMFLDDVRFGFVTGSLFRLGLRIPCLCSPCTRRLVHPYFPVPISLCHQGFRGLSYHMLFYTHCRPSA